MGWLHLYFRGNYAYLKSVLASIIVVVESIAIGFPQSTLSLTFQVVFLQVFQYPSTVPFSANLSSGLAVALLEWQSIQTFDTSDRPSNLLNSYSPFLHPPRLPTFAPSDRPSNFLTHRSPFPFPQPLIALFAFTWVAIALGYT
jgi:hypothetical protein